MPSKLDLTVPCPGSLQLQEKVAPTPPTFEQAEGTGGHIVALKHSTGAGAEWGLGRKFEVEGQKLEVDDDMLDGAMIYKDEAQAGGRYEDPVAIPDVHPTECFGTPDYWRCIIEVYLKLLKVIDYKYGHRYVEVFECYQLIAYAAGVIRSLNLPADFPVMLVIVQPRSYSGPGPVREWTTTAGEIIRMCHEVIYPRVELALGVNPPTFTGRHCQDCRARRACRTYQQTGESLVDFSGVAEIRELNNETIGQELRLLKEAIKRLEGRYTGLYEQAANLGRSGARISHWKMDAANGKLKWKDDTTTDQVAGMGDLLGVPVRKPPALITPTQAIKAGIDESVIMQYAERPRGAMRLVQDDSTALRKIFKGITTNE
jgi:hypothetical protein